jgi:hypothetical protein
LQYDVRDGRRRIPISPNDAFDASDLNNFYFAAAAGRKKSANARFSSSVY